MNQNAFCEYCMKEEKYIVSEVSKIATLNEEEISYDGKEAFCSQCKNEIFVNSICRDNLEKLYMEYKKKHDLIQNDKILLMLKKYDISEEALSIILGFSKETIRRYIHGDMISVHDSDVLKKIYNNIQYYSIVLQTNKDKIKPNEYLRSRKAVSFITSSCNVERKIDEVIKYILTRCDDITHLMVHKLLYYVQAFYYVFTDHFLFDEDCIAKARGPVFESVWNRYEFYGFDNINNEILNNEDLKLEDIEKNVVEGVLKFYGCYSGKILEKMVENEAPWILTRKDILSNNKNNDISSIEDYEFIKKELISIYFKGIKDKYNIISLIDMEKYSKDIFEKISF